MSNFESAKTVGELRAILNNLPDDIVLFQTSSNSSGYRKKILVLSIDDSNKSFNSYYNNIKTYQCTQDKIKGTYNNLTKIVIFGS